MGSYSPQRNSPTSGYFGMFIYKFTLDYGELQHQWLINSMLMSLSVLLPLLQWPSPTFISVVHICGHTSKLITWNLPTSNLSCCLSRAWPQPPVLLPTPNTAKTLSNTHHELPAPPASPCPSPFLDWCSNILTSNLVPQVPSLDNCQNMNKP